MAGTSQGGCVAVLDIGKTLAKASLWSPERELIDRRTYLNKRHIANGYPALDVHGIERWLVEALTVFAHKGEIRAIVPVAHGAAGAVVNGDALALDPLDYEAELPGEFAEKYRALRDGFSVTGSPCLPCGLNLGAQLYWLESIAPDAFERGTIVTWPQYWAWRLSGVAATETSSLGCHTDLWNPFTGKASPLAESRGWSARLAPLRAAGDILGPVKEEWIKRCGLPADCVVYCGMHDSNAALFAMRGYEEAGTQDCTILSTGTWFVAMRSLPKGADSGALPENRDCLANVDVAGTIVPSARFMGGREAELIEASGDMIDVDEHGALLMRTAKTVVANGLYALPSFQKGVGPFPDHLGTWLGGRPTDQITRRAVAGLYLALVANVSLGLIGSKGPLVIEGRFAGDPVFTGAMAALRRNVYLADARDNIALGGLRLIDGALPTHAALTPARPFDFPISEYAAAWEAHTRAQ